jgi:Mn2+/Fe2+ NRAMP family transporter
MKNWKKILGPGILFASTAIGVSHLVQSTQAGAQFGLSLLWAIILANVLKFPFFEFSSRYASVKGESILKGYYDLNKIWLYAYMGVTFISMFFVTGAVGIVTYGFMENLFELNKLTDIPHFTLFLLFIVATSILWIGQFSTLNKLIKGLGIVLLLTTVIAFIAAIQGGPATSKSLFPELNTDSIAFILPLMGWMPTAVDLSAWNSIWTIERIKESNYKPTLKETLREFNFGYWASAVLAVFFLLMGAFLIYDTGEVVPKQPADFSAFIVSLYTRSIGDWIYYVIAAASFSIMFSTFITVLDGYSRTISHCFSLISTRELELNQMYKSTLILISIGGLALILSFLDDPTGLKGIVNTATIISFLIAPVVAILNFKIVRQKDFGEHKPGVFLQILSYLGIIYLIGFSLYFLYSLVW